MQTKLEAEDGGFRVTGNKENTAHVATALGLKGDGETANVAYKAGCGQGVDAKWKSTADCIQPVSCRLDYNGNTVLKPKSGTSGKNTVCVDLDYVAEEQAEPSAPGGVPEPLEELEPPVPSEAQVVKPAGKGNAVRRTLWRGLQRLGLVS